MCESPAGFDSTPIFIESFYHESFLTMKQNFHISKPVLKQRISIILWLGITFSMITKIDAQCTPPAAETCEEASVLCSLDELNGYACNNPSTVPFDCPLIRKGYNTSWWAFVSQGGAATITMIVGSCTSNQGMAYGIMGDCLCREEIITRQKPCIIPNSIDSVKINLTPCKTYFIWVDGCKGDICDFTINTTGGKRPSLSPLGLINNTELGI